MMYCKLERYQCSPFRTLDKVCLFISVLFQSALKKLHSFVTGRILETKVAGHFMATMVRSFAKVSISVITDLPPCS